jgi:hypothetical protein
MIFKNKIFSIIQKYKTCWSIFIFFPSILWTGDDQLEDLAKFGYSPDMKVKF